MRPGRLLKHLKWLSIFGSIAILVIALTNPAPTPEAEAQAKIQSHLERRVKIADALAPFFVSETLPDRLSLDLDDGLSGEFIPQYTIDPILQSESERLLRRYKPDYGAIFMMDADTGRVLAWESFQKSAREPVNLISRATYPAASVFKVVTATAAVDDAGVDPSHKIRFNGGNYTLYRKNVLSDKINRWTRAVTLREAFAQSYNTAFGRLSLEKLSPETLGDYAGRFMFNEKIPSDFPVDMGVAEIPAESGYELTEAASGYNRKNRMSPVQGAMIAASVINGGRMVMPYIVEELRDQEGNIAHQAKILDNGLIMTPESAESVRELMEETILRGTSRKTFRGLVKDRRFRELTMGGKTGHLTGDNPRGRVDWFVGYASDGNRRIALAALTVNKEYWTVKSSYLGQTLFRKYFEPVMRERSVSSAR